MDHHIELIKEYEGLYWAWRNGNRGRAAKGDPQGHLFVVDTKRLHAIATLLHGHYARLPDEDYRTCMWARRAHLHAHNRHGEVFDGTCPVAWARAMREGRRVG